jgi:Flp pilus assembly protein TadD
VAGNAEVALGDLQAAQQHFQQAAEDPGLESIAYANLALVSFESGDDEAAIRAARQLLRRWFFIIFSELNRKKVKLK